MGMSLVERLDGIFKDPENFDISGMCKPELVTVELARELMEAYLVQGKWNKLYRAGYDPHYFSQRGDSGIIGKWVSHGRKSKEYLKLYFDQVFPAEIRKTSAEEVTAND